MPPDAAAYLLLALNLLVVAAILILPVLVLLRVLVPLRRRRTTGRRSPSPAAARSPGEGTAGGERLLRRCDDCGTGWKGVRGRDRSRTGLKVRRWVRRRARAREKQAPSWSKRQGWSRCPSCLSTNVRTSSKHATDA